MDIYPTNEPTDYIKQHKQEIERPTGTNEFRTTSGPYNLIEIAKSLEKLKKIRSFRKEEYSRIYPEITGFDSDPYDKEACVLFTETTEGEITSTARLAYDGANGLPEDNLISDLITEHRAQGLQLCELGRFIISDKAKGVLKSYYQAFHLIAIGKNIDSILMVMKQKDIKFHERILDVQVLKKELGVTFGSEHQYACVEWKIKSTPPEFFSWCGLDKPKKQRELNPIKKEDKK